MKKNRILSIGTMYVDINCINFDFDEGLFHSKEVVGNGYQLELGGSALNFAKTLSILGLDSHFIGKTGQDRMGDVLLELLQQNNIKPAVIRNERVQTNLAIHYIRHDGISIMSSCGNANQSITADDIHDKLLSLLDTVDYLYFGGVFKLKHILPDLADILKRAQQNGVKTILDHGRINNSVSKENIQAVRDLLSVTDIYLPSYDEFLALWESQTLDEGFAKVKTTGNPITIIKMAEKGATGFAENQAYYVNSYPVQAINTVGAGDSFNAGFIKAYTDGMNITGSMQFACATAATKISSEDALSLGKIQALFNTH